MRIFIDIGHPAHVHYFRNFITIMEGRGHKFFIIARDKEVSHDLLRHYNIKYTSRGKGRKGLFGKLIYLIEADLKLLKHAKKFNPDLFLSFGSAYAAQVSKILRKPHIAFDDTEHAKFEHLMYVPFSDVILTPSCFAKNFGKKHIYFDSYMELCYLHPNHIKVDKNILSRLRIKEDKYIILRFVSWSASHDLGQTGLKSETKNKIVDLLKKDFKIFISSEGKLPSNLQKYKLIIDPADLHSVLANASLYIGEGSTTASECSVLGIPNIYINSLTVGYCKEQEEKYELCFHLKNESSIIELIKKIISKNKINQEWDRKRAKMIADKIDVTAFMVWFIENYPKSFRILKENPDYQYNFRRS